MVPDPLDRFLIMLLKVVEKKVDRYEVAPPKLVVYDLKEHKIARTVPWPNGEEARERQRHVLAGRQAVVLLRRRSAESTTPPSSNRSTRGICEADSRKGSGVSISTA